MTPEWIKVGDNEGQIPNHIADLLRDMGVVDSDNGFMLSMISSVYSIISRRYFMEDDNKFDFLTDELRLELIHVLQSIPGVIPPVIEQIAQDQVEEKPPLVAENKQSLFKGIYISSVRDDNLQERLEMGDFVLSNRAHNTLIRGGIIPKSFGQIHALDLAMLSEKDLLSVRQLGPTILKEIKDLMAIILESKLIDVDSEK